MEFYDELLPVGTAGCLRDAVGDEPGKLIILLPAGMTCPPEISELISEHRRSRADLTVILNPGDRAHARTGQASGIYICDSSIVQHIPPAGYFDIKEGLIPEMLSAGKTIHAAELEADAGDFRDTRGYLHAVASYVETGPNRSSVLQSRLNSGAEDVWVAESARVEADAKVYGPAVIMDNVTIAGGAVVIGPAVIESNVTISEGAVISDSVLWSGARIGPDCRIDGCVIDGDTIVPGGSVVRAQAVTRKHRQGPILTTVCAGVLPLLALGGLVGRMLRNMGDRVSGLTYALQSSPEKDNRRAPVWARFDRKTVLTSLALVSVLIAFIWSYGHSLADLWRLWNESDEYSSGLLVPVLAGYILYSRRRDLAQCSFKPCGWGLLAFGLAQMIRFLGLYLMYGSAERLSIVLSIAALTLLLAGRQFFRKVWPILLFLCLMLPWPNSIQNYIGLNLQRYATSSAVFCLEVISYEVVQEGNVIHIGDVSVAVAEACNGLRMITAFFVISGLVVLLVDRAWWEKCATLCDWLLPLFSSQFSKVSIGRIYSMTLAGMR